MKMPPLTVHCPKCGTSVPVSAELAENRIRCPRCGGEFAVPVPPPINLPETLQTASEMPPIPPVPEGFSVQREEKLPDQLPETHAEPPAALPDLSADQNSADRKIDGHLNSGLEDEDSGLEDALDELDEDDEEDSPFWLRAPFLFGLGVIAALLVMILILVLKQPAPVPVSAPMPESGFEQIADRLAVSDEGKREIASDDFNPNGSGIDLKLTGEGESEAGDENSDETGDSAKAASIEESRLETPAEDFLTETVPAEHPQEPEPEETKTAESPEPEPAADEALAGQSAVALPDAEISLAVLNISEQLTLPLKSVEIPGWTLPEWVKLLADMTHIPISIPFEAFESFPRTASQTAAVHLPETTAGGLLSEAARLFGLDAVQNPDGVILMPPKSPVQSRTLDLADLLNGQVSAGSVPVPADENLTAHWLPSPLTAEALTAYLTDLSFPDGGTSNDKISGGGFSDNRTPAAEQENMFTWNGTQLTITGDAPFVARACRNIEILRTLRKISPGTEWSSEELIPGTIGREDLSQPLSIGFLTPPTLYEGLEFLAQTVGKRFLIDTAALRNAGISEQTRRPFRSEAHPAFWVISEYLAGYGLTWGMPTADLIFVTTKERGWISTEVHLCRNPNQAPEDLPELIPESVLPLLMSGNLHYWIDPVSGSLIVQAEADIQRTICRILTTGETTPKTAPETAPAVPLSANETKTDAVNANEANVTEINANDVNMNEQANDPQPEPQSDAEKR